MSAMDDPQQPTVTCGTRVRSQHESQQRAGRLAAAIKARGIQPGERVALVMRNDIEFLEVSLAVASCGGNPVPVNWHWTGSEICHLLGDSGARLVIAHTEFISSAEDAVSQLQNPVDIIEVAMPGELLAELGVSSELARPSGKYVTLEELLRETETPLPHQEGAIVDSMGMVYTSGTTGLPKGVLRERMSPHQLLSIAGGTATRMGLKPGGQMLVAGPMYHTSPNALAVLALRMGTNITIMPRFDAERFLQLIQEHRIEQAKIVPTMLSRLLSLPAETQSQYDVSSLTHLIHSAAPCPPEVKRRSIEWFGNALIEFYGCSEAGTITWISAEEWTQRPGNVGRPVDGAEVRIVSSDGVVLPAGEVGEVYVTGADYWPKFSYINHEGSDPSPVPGFVTVGDHGYVDSEGFLYLTGRTSEVIISGGVNIYPAEVENAIMKLTTAEDVAVFGVPGGDLGEAVAAHVVARPGTTLTGEGIRKAIATELAKYKIPTRLEIVDTLPREDSGKIFKSRLIAQYL